MQKLSKLVVVEVDRDNTHRAMMFLILNPQVEITKLNMFDFNYRGCQEFLTEQLGLTTEELIAKPWWHHDLRRGASFIDRANLDILANELGCPIEYLEVYRDKSNPENTTESRQLFTPIT
jgi:hypothetical protein